MLTYEWNQEKNKHLKSTRKISFEEIVKAITLDNGLIEIIKNSDNYPNQKVFVVRIKGYIYCCPFVEDNDKYFLKTIFPSSKLTKLLIKK